MFAKYLHIPDRIQWLEREKGIEPSALSLGS